MAGMEFGSGSIAVPIDRAGTGVRVELWSEVETPFCPQHGGTWADDLTCSWCTHEDGRAKPDPEPTLQAVLALSEDEAVELATMILAQVTHVRAQRLPQDLTKP